MMYREGKVSAGCHTLQASAPTVRRPFPVRLIPLLLALAALAPCPRSASAEEPAKPRLVVLVYFDQFRGDYLARWSAQFGEGGFKRLDRRRCVVPELPLPVRLHRHRRRARLGRHRLPARRPRRRRQRLVRRDGWQVGQLRRVRPPQQVPTRTAEGETDERRARSGGVSPERLLKPTVADALKAATGGKAKVGHSVAQEPRRRAARRARRRTLLLDGRRHRAVRHLDVLPRRDPPVGGGIQQGWPR